MTDGIMVRKQLISKTRYTLAILEDGRVTNGDIDSKYTYMHIDSHDTGLVTIKGEETEYYICMDDEGRIYGSKNMGEECEFVESLTVDNYKCYHRSISKKNSKKNRYLAISRLGHVKSVPHQRNHTSRVKFNYQPIKS